VAPLKPAPDAVVIDTTGIAVDDIVGQVLDLARVRIALDR
jgi:cytidylate kinase